MANGEWSEYLIITHEFQNNNRRLETPPTLLPHLGIQDVLYARVAIRTPRIAHVVEAPSVAPLDPGKLTLAQHVLKPQVRIDGNRRQ